MSGRIIAGFGFSTKASQTSLKAALAAVRAGWQIDAFATLADKIDLVRALGAEMGVEVIAVNGPLPATVTQSPRVLSERSTGSVAEGCALAAAGAGAYLLATRAISPDRLATCALARSKGDEA